MNRQKKIAEQAGHIIRVRYYGGTYIASGGGKRTSYTGGPEMAAHAHALKLFGSRSNYSLTKMAEPNTWRATGEGR